MSGMHLGARSVSATGEYKMAPSPRFVDLPVQGISQARPHAVSAGHRQPLPSLGFCSLESWVCSWSPVAAARQLTRPPPRPAERVAPADLDCPEHRRRRRPGEAHNMYLSLWFHYARYGL